MVVYCFNSVSTDMNKENLNPNKLHKFSRFSWSKGSHEPRVSKFKVIESDWKKRTVLPSEKEQEI